MIAVDSEKKRILDTELKKYRIRKERAAFLHDGYALEVIDLQIRRIEAEIEGDIVKMMAYARKIWTLQENGRAEWEKTN